jgi:hypothetical protein
MVCHDGTPSSTPRSYDDINFYVKGYYGPHTELQEFTIKVRLYSVRCMTRKINRLSLMCSPDRIYLADGCKSLAQPIGS